MESCFAAFFFFFFNLALAFCLNFSTSSTDESLVEFVVVAPRTQGLLHMCPAGIMVRLMNTVLMSAMGYVLISLTACQKEGEN